MNNTITIEQLEAQCNKVKWQGKHSFTAACIAHDDRNPSMSVTEGRDGTLLLHCHAGCPQDALLEAAGMLGNKPLASPIQAVQRSTGPSPADTEGTEERARRAVSLATPAPSNNEYLMRKGTQPHGIGVLGELYPDLPKPARNKGNVLVLPLYNIRGEIVSCQFICGDGTKPYMRGPKRKGGFYRIEGNERIWICEGFATGASLHEDTGDTVICAFDSNGLLPVTDAISSLYGLKREIIIMADDDWQTDGNPGLTKAKQAAETCGVKWVQPDFTGYVRGPKDTDYNDLRVLRNG